MPDARVHVYKSMKNLRINPEVPVIARKSIVNRKELKERRESELLFVFPAFFAVIFLLSEPIRF
jgi:hypothetical protein